MRKPRAKRAPRGPRVRTRGARKGEQLYGIWAVQCKECKAKFRVYGLKPKLCVVCQSMNIEAKPGRPNKQERAERDLRFAAAGIRLMQMFLDAFGFQMPPPPPFPRRPPMSMSRDEAARWLADQANVGLKRPKESGFRPEDISRSAEYRDSACRRAARRLHPDSGGSHELFVKLQEVKEILNVQ